MHENELEKIALIAHFISFEKESIIFKEGDTGDKMYVIIEGHTAVIKGVSTNDSSVIAFLGPGDCFGELALIDDSPRSATLKAVEPVNCIYINKNEFMDLLFANKSLLLGMFKILTSRLRETSNLLNALSKESAIEEIEKNKNSNKHESFGLFRKLLNIKLPQGKLASEVLSDLSDITDISEIKPLLYNEISDTALGQRLVEAGEINQAQLIRAMRRAQQTGNPLARTLIAMRFIPPAVLQDFLMRQKIMDNISHADESSLLEIIEKSGIISADKKNDIQNKADKNEQNLCDIIVSENILSKNEISVIIDNKNQFALKYLKPEDLEKNALNLFPPDFIKENKIIPISKRGKDLNIGMLTPSDSGTVKMLEIFVNMHIVPVLILKRNFNELFEYISANTASQTKTKKRFEFNFMANAVDKFLDSSIDEKPQTHIVDFLDDLLKQAVISGVSDIHIEPQPEKNRIRFRIDGVLHDVLSYPMTFHPRIVSAVKIKADMDIANKMLPQDGKMIFKTTECECVIRVSSLPTSHGEKLVMRIHKENDVTFGLCELGFDNKQYIKMNSLTNAPYGMLLVVGPVGSGKTTTLYSVLNTFDVLEKNIITLEDPIEYELPGINHIQVNNKTGLDFVVGLKAILRQDPNIIMVGEIRDVETARIATRASCTGVLMLSTMHTNDAPSTVTALLHLGVEPFFIANALVGVVAQRLIRKICPHCKQSYEPSPQTLEMLKLDKKKEYIFFQGAGCQNCFYTGYKGRIGIYEIMPFSEKLKELTLNRSNESIIEEQAVKEGMITLRQSALYKVLEGITTADELFRVTAQSEIEFKS